MNIREPARQALRNLMSAKLRSLLAVLGILVGTASVVTLVTGGQAATEKALEQFKALGTNLLDVRFDRPVNPDRPSNQNISYEDVMQTTKYVPNLLTVAPYSNAYVEISFEGEKLEGYVLGATENLQKILKIKVRQGQFVSFVDSSERYCVLGADLAKTIQAKYVGHLQGQQIRLGSDFYTIIGILDHWPESSFFYTNINQAVLVPIRGIQLLEPNAKIRSILMTFKPNSDINAIKKAVTAYYGNKIPEQKLLIRSPKEVIDKMESQHRIFTLLLGLIGGISLLVGGIGVMNVMLVSVTERKREIGLRKALGATKRDIQQLFLMESVILALFGGALGVLCGVVLAEVIAYFADWAMKLYLLPIVIGFFVSAITGVFFGSYPAYTAAKLNPIDALRYE